MNTIQFLEAGSTELGQMHVNIWQSDQGSPRSSSLHGIALRTSSRGCAGLHQANAAANARGRWKTCGRIGETPGHPDGHLPRRASRDLFQWIGAAVDRNGRDEIKALHRGIEVPAEPAHQPDGVDARNVSLEFFLNNRRVAWRAASEPRHGRRTCLPASWPTADRTMAYPAPVERAQDCAKRRHRPVREGMLADRRSAPSRLAPASQSERRCRPLQVNGRSARLLDAMG